MPVIGCGKTANKTGVYVQCEYCGKPVYKTQSQYRKREHHFCSNKCQAMARHDSAYEDRPCEMCGKSMHVSKISTQRFCSDTCQNKWQKTRTGINNPKYTWIEYICDNCKSVFMDSAYKKNAQSHHFCCKKCRRDWYANVWSQREEWREESRKRAVRILANNPITRSKPQIIVDGILTSLGIPYTNEKAFGHYSIDDYLHENNLAIEVMGDYWHCSPVKYSSITNDVQKNAIRRDTSKHTYMQKYHNINILYLWEYDIIHRENVVRKLIAKYVDNSGVLCNYHSFNYAECGNDIIISDGIIPYQDMKVEERERHYSKTAS